MKVRTLSATSWSAMIQSAPEAVSLPRISLLWSWGVPGRRVTLALMVPILIIHHSGTLGRIQTAFLTPRPEIALAAFWLARLRSWKDSLRSSSGWRGLTYHRAVLSLHNISNVSFFIFSLGRTLPIMIPSYPSLPANLSMTSRLKFQYSGISQVKFFTTSSYWKSFPASLENMRRNN